MPLLQPQNIGPQAAPAAVQQPTEQPTEQPSPGGMPAKASPEDQRAYERVVVAGMSLLNDDNIREKVFAMLENGKGAKAKVLGSAALHLFSIIKEKSPQEIPENIIGSAAIEIMMMLAEEADRAGVFVVDERTLKGAGQVLIRGLADMYGIPQEQIDAVASGESQGQPEIPPEAPAEPTAGQNVTNQMRV